MQIVESIPGMAVCEGMGERRSVNMLLTGDQPVGTWVLVFLGSAREVLDEAEAKRIQAALQLVGQVNEGSDPNDLNTLMDQAFADIVPAAGKSH